MRDDWGQQGVRVETVREKRLCDSRRGELPVLCLVLLLAILINIKGVLFLGILMLDGLIITYLLWFLIKGRRNYILLARDGVYLVRNGWAVCIPWQMIEKVENVLYRRRQYSKMYFRIHYKPDLMDKITGTPIVLDGEHDYHFPYSGKALIVFSKYTRHV